MTRSDKTEKRDEAVATNGEAALVVIVVAMVVQGRTGSVAVEVVMAMAAVVPVAAAMEVAAAVVVAGGKWQ